MKRISVLVLLFCCFLQGFVFAETNHIKNEYALEKDAIAVLTALDVVDSDISEELSDNFTRGEFAYALSKLMLPEELSEPRLYFYDVPTDDDYCAAISTLVNLGAVSRAQTEFRPADTITRNEAVKMVMYLLGYSVMAEESGGYPSGYLKYAQRCNVLDKVSENQQLTKSAGLIMLYNMLHTNVNDVIYTTSETKIKSGNGIYMTEILSIYNKNDVLNDNGITSLVGKSDLNENQYSVGDVRFYAQKDYKNMLGKSVSLYYKKDKSANKNTVVALVENDNREWRASAEDIKTGDITKWVYSDSEDGYKEKSRTVSERAAYIYNGIALSGKEVTDYKNLFIPKIGNVRFLDNNNDGVAEVVFINSYYNLVVGFYDSKSETLYDKRNNATEKKSISFKDKDYVITDASGAVKGFSDITEKWKCLLVGESIAKDFVNVTVSDKVVAGEISDVRSSDGKTMYRIDGGLYKSSLEFNEELQPGKSGKFYINALNEIIYFDGSLGDAALFCYIVDTAYTASFDGKVELKCYSDDNAERILRVADKVKIDGVTYKKLDQSVYDLIKNNVGKIVRIKLDHEGNVNMIDTDADDADGGSEFSVFPGCDNTEQRYEFYSQTIAGIAALTPDTKVFVVPTNGDSDQILVSDYNVLVSITGGNRISIPMTLYRTKKDNVAIAAMIVKVRDTGFSLENVNVAGGRLMGIVLDIAEAVDQDGEACYELTINSNGKRETVYTAEKKTIEFLNGDSVCKIGKGDLIIYGYDKNKRINTGNIRVVYDRDKDWFNTKDIPLYSDEYSANRNYKKVFVYSKTDYSNFYRVSSLPCDRVANEQDLYIYNLGDFKTILLYDSERDTVREASTEDIVCYKDTGNECSKIVFYKTYTQSGGFCIIYR